MLSAKEIEEWYQAWFVAGGVKTFREQVLEEAARLLEDQLMDRASADAIRALKEKT